MLTVLTNESPSLSIALLIGMSRVKDSPDIIESDGSGEFSTGAVFFPSCLKTLRFTPTADCKAGN
jgi:hypothetical protein